MTVAAVGSRGAEPENFACFCCHGTMDAPNFSESGSTTGAGESHRCLAKSQCSQKHIATSNTAAEFGSRIGAAAFAALQTHEV